MNKVFFVVVEPRFVANRAGVVGKTMGKNAGSGLFGLTMEQTLVVAVSLVTIIAVPAFVITALNYGPLQKRVAARDTARVEVVRELHKVYVSLT